MFVNKMKAYSALQKAIPKYLSMSSHALHFPISL
jgi:hypothetical protein